MNIYIPLARKKYMARPAQKSPSLTEAKKEYHISLKHLRDAYQREILSAVSVSIDNAFSSGNLPFVENYKSLVDYVTRNPEDPRVFNQLEKILSGDLGVGKVEEVREPKKPQESYEPKERKKRRFKRRYWTVGEAIDAMKSEDEKKWGKERTRAAYYQKIRYLDETKKATTLYHDGRIARICIADMKSLLPELTQYSPR